MKTNLLLPIIFFFLPIYGIAQTVAYLESNEDFINPDRGFYHPISSADHPTLDAATITGYRQNSFTPWNANYQVKTSLIFRYYILEDFRSSALSASFLNNMRADFEALRAAGMRLILRFTYNNDPDTLCGESACPPYLDASKSRVLQHIAQIKPILQANADVICAVQLGFIGVWGEGYYTDHFGDASDAGDGKITDANWQKRNEVLAAMLDAVPAERMIQVRYPQLKQRYVYGIDAATSSPALPSAEAYSGTDKARIGFHNDCFLADSNDQGTYTDYGNDNSDTNTAISELKPYFAMDGQYVAVGGETCKDDVFSPENDCASNGGVAVSEMEYLNYSYINSNYNNDVNNDWQTGGCMDEVKRRLGYRFVLDNGTYPGQATAGTEMSVALNFRNTGFAAPFNERVLQLVLRNTSTSQVFKLPVNGNNTDTQFWLPGNPISLNGTVNLPSSIPSGDYEMLLHIADFSNCGRVADRPEYSIRLANQSMWEAQTGYNDLNHVISIASDATNGEDCITIDGAYSEWATVSNLASNGTNGLSSLKATDDPEKLYLYAEGNLETHYQLFIDSDNDNSGPNEYLNGAWGDNGFNYMVENGLLYLYTGSDTDWSWNQIGSAVAVKGSDKIELSIEKSLFSNLAGTIRLGFSTLDGTWRTIGKIPDNTTGSFYTFNNQGCRPCTPDDILLESHETGAGIYGTNAAIESTQTIYPDAEIEYRAGNLITLKAGFTAKQDARFTARIEGCTNSTLPPNVQSRAIASPASGMRIYPNPFSDYIDINVQVRHSGLHALTVYDALGQIVATPLPYQWYEEGAYQVRWSIQNPSRLLIAVLESESGQVSQKLIRVE